jgi:hypothetical protein
VVHGDADVGLPGRVVQTRDPQVDRVHDREEVVACLAGHAPGLVGDGRSPVDVGGRVQQLEVAFPELRLGDGIHLDLQIGWCDLERLDGGAGDHLELRVRWPDPEGVDPGPPVVDVGADPRRRVVVTS